MALDALFKLDPTSPTSNSNYAGANIAENCAPSGINNALRALGGFVAQQLCYQSAAISASVSTNICTTSTGLLVPIVGSGAINSLGTVPGEQASAAVLRFLQFSSSASLSNGAALRLLGNASRRTQPGDIGGYIHVGSADVWHEFLWSRAADGDGSFSSISASVAAVTSLSTSTIHVAGVQEFPRYTFLAHKNGTAQTSLSGSVTVVTFGTEDWDVGGYFSSSTYTPPAGKYRLTAQTVVFNLFGVAAPQGTIEFGIYKNGSLHRSVQGDRNTSASTSTLQVSCIVDANGTDAFDVRIDHNGTSTQPYAASGATDKTFFCGERI